MVIHNGVIMTKVKLTANWRNTQLSPTLKPTTMEMKLMELLKLIGLVLRLLTQTLLDGCKCQELLLITRFTIQLIMSGI
ncbi:Uncharacterised protein [Chlamydia trachomatis]|nr:Uncharacterised protein [Chlamydia trachomatis]